MPPKRKLVRIKRDRKPTAIGRWRAWIYPLDGPRGEAYDYLEVSSREARDAAIAAIMADRNYVEVKE